jgi:hypothetical protein
VAENDDTYRPTRKQIETECACLRMFVWSRAERRRRWVGPRRTVQEPAIRTYRLADILGRDQADSYFRDEQRPA